MKGRETLLLGSLRAPEWIMLGVVGFGAYAVYRMARSPKPLPPSADDVPILSLPLLPGAPLPPAPGTLLVPGELNGLRSGDWFAGRVEGILERDLVELGFTGASTRPDAPNAPSAKVAIYDLNEARRAGFPSWALANPGRGTRWFYGRWAPEKRPARPPWLIALWRASPPRTS